MNNKQRITIIMPVYNAERFIIDTLYKLEDQSYKNFKILLINDGSTDKTLEKIYSYLESGKLDIELINQENKGEGGARNSGIGKLESEYVLFLDCDDTLENNALELMIKEMKGDIDIVCTGYRKVDKYGVVLGEEKYIESEYTSDEIMKEFLLRNINPGIGNTLIKSQIIKNSNLYFSNYKYGADNLYFRELLLKIKKIKVLKQITFNYIKNETSLMNQKFTEKRLDSIFSVIETQETLIKNTRLDLLEYSKIFLLNEVIGILLIKPEIYEDLKKYIQPIKLNIVLKRKDKRKYIYLLFLKMPRLCVFLLKNKIIKKYLAKVKNG